MCLFIANCEVRCCSVYLRLIPSRLGVVSKFVIVIITEKQFISKDHVCAYATAPSRLRESLFKPLIIQTSLSDECLTCGTLLFDSSPFAQVPYSYHSQI